MSLSPSRFETLFDQPTFAIEPPAVLTSGQDERLRLTDGFVRGDSVVGRFAATPALLAVKVRPDGRPMRVRLSLLLDSDTIQWWTTRVPDGSGVPEHLPRLLLVRSQGRLRQALVVSRHQSGRDARHQSGRDARQTPVCAVFEVDPGELTEDGLLIVEVADAAAVLPGWAADVLARQPAVGMRVDRIEIEPADGLAVWSSSSAVTWADLLPHPSGRARSGVVVINPDHVGPPPAGDALRVALQVRPRPRDARGSIATRAMRRAGRALGWRRVRTALGLPDTSARPVWMPGTATLAAPMRRPAVRACAVQLTDGRQLPVDVTAGNAGTVELLITGEFDGPVLARVDADTRLARSVGFHVVEVTAQRLARPLPVEALVPQPTGAAPPYQVEREG